MSEKILKDLFGEEEEEVSDASDEDYKEEAVEDGSDEDHSDEDSDEDSDKDAGPVCSICQGALTLEMLRCDNDDCPRGWFHFRCVGMKDAAEASTAAWFCSECLKESWMED